MRILDLLESFLILDPVCVWSWSSIPGEGHAVAPNQTQLPFDFSRSPGKKSGAPYQQALLAVVGCVVIGGALKVKIASQDAK